MHSTKIDGLVMALGFILRRIHRINKKKKCIEKSREKDLNAAIPRARGDEKWPKLRAVDDNLYSEAEAFTGNARFLEIGRKTRLIMMISSSSSSSGLSLAPSLTNPKKFSGPPR
ncbi:conserved hypothetical protein [Ricinus communis]|uniref:Uncharacterized protein n=1 Tax=Ricinus communis TaxID=3988 RepID=B9S432_RICCO|nr:conserved hypothetical protein [Ricinus communis]